MNVKNRYLIALNFVVLAVALFFGLYVHAQVPDSSQVKLATNGGIIGDANYALWAAPYRGTTAPSGPVTGALWCDTNFSPCILKQYTGSTWIAPQVNAAIPTQADVSSFPGSPVDGQIFFSKAPPSLWVYNSTTALWATFALPMMTSSGNLHDVYTAAVIAAPGAPTVAANTGGSMGAGTYSFKVTCRNVDGGETTGGTVSANVTVVASGSVDLSAIPTCGSGATNRNIYRSKVGQQSTGPWYWVANIADNTTTTLSNGTIDSSTSLLVPDINFSAPLPGSWVTINNTANPTTGGCGGTGATRGTLACYAGLSGLIVDPGSGLTTDAGILRASCSIASYSSGDYTLQYRIVLLSANGTTYPTISNPAFFGMRVGTADNAVRFAAIAGNSATDYPVGCNNPFVTNNLPWTPTTAPAIGNFGRSSVGAGVYCNSANKVGIWPPINNLPFWVRAVRRGNNINFYYSADGVNWTVLINCANANTTSAACSNNQAAFGTSALDHVELPVGYSNNSGGAQPSKGWIEIDSFTLAVN